ncbi:CHAT domain-containing protein [Dapis sp. BLCC M229]|uniref:CHAT domain-containing protein n=1 Tax=Dapis sp. BLCC M229 TaxID=3400188 RepID=UPI003CF22572
MAITISAIPRIIIIPNVLAQTPAPEVENSPESSAPKTKADKLFETGVEQFRRGTFDEALETYEQVLTIRKELGDQGGIAQTLNNIGDVYINQREYSKALDVLQKALTIRRQINDRSGVGETLNLIGFVYQRQREFSQALNLHQEALDISEAISDRQNEGESLHNIGAVKASQRQLDQALKFYQEALTIREEVDDRRDLGRTLNNMGVVYFNQGNYDKALETYQKALTVRREINDSAGVGRLLNNIGFVYREKDENSEAIKYFQQAVVMLESVGDQRSVGRIYGFIGALYQKEGEESEALAAYEKGLEAAKVAEDKTGQLEALSYLGDAYYEIGENAKAKSIYEAALAFYEKEEEDRAAEGEAMIGLGKVYNRLGENQKAKQILLKSLPINKKVGEKSVIAANMNALGEAYYSSGDYSIALNYHKLALDNLPDKDDKNAVAIAYQGIGDALFELKQYPQALENLEQALAIYKENEKTAKAGRIYGQLGTILVAQEKPELAVVFYKQAVNIHETMRSQESQKSLLENPETVYRNLADLLLQQERIFEAQQVLDLLKIQELDNYLGNVTGNQITATGVKLLAAEEKILAEDTKNILNLEIDKNNLKPNLSQFNSLQEKLKKLPGTVLFYPLILSEKLELVLITAEGEAIHKTVSVKPEEINEAIAEFRLTISNPIGDVKTSAEKLYGWLIKPIEDELTKANINTIIYAPDNQLRYLPLTALYDGEKWLVERFSVNNIIAASLTNFETQSKNQPRVLAAALTEGKYQVQIGTRQVNLRLTTGELVENLAEIIPGTRKLVNSEFSSQTTINNFNDYNILHLDTPVVLLTEQEGNGKPEDSFILFGDGERLTLRDMENWSFEIDLVVLSASETNISGQMGNGEEIVGLGYQMQNAGAETIIASLWRVNDDSDELMNTFYTVLQEGKSKAEALRAAQINMITGKDKEGNNPYYWASFILMRNGF